MTNKTSYERDIQDLQVKVAFLEDNLTKLSDEYFTQQKELQKLSMTVDALINKLAKTQDNENDSTVMVDERPPHY